ncbi:MAG: MlaC/ttg2D family ABC transporter substrate-binding protein [Methylococcales bacterium]
MINLRSASAKRLATIGVLFLALLCIVPGRATGADIAESQAMVENTTSQVLDTLKKNEERLKNDKTELYRLVNDIIVPHFDFRSMSRLVLAKHWREASGEQQQRFIEEFKAHMVRTYSTAMLDFASETVKFLPVRAGSDNTKALSRMEITQPGGGPPVKMDLRMVQRDDAWMVYDISIDGVSLVTNYRQSFSDEVFKNGIDSLIDKLIEKNRRRVN